MPHDTMFAPIPSAYAAAAALTKIATEAAPDTSVNLTISTMISEVQVDVAVKGKDLANQPAMRQFTDSVKDRPYLYCVSFALTVNLGGGARDVRVVFREHENQLGLPFFKFEHKGNLQVVLAVADGLGKYLRASSKTELVAASMPEAERDLIRFKEQSVSELQSTVERLGSFILDMAKQQSQHLTQLTTELERKYQEREKALEQKSQQQQAELDTKQKAFEQAKKEFDDRDRTHVRRDLLKKLNDIVESQRNPAVLPATAAKRWGTHLICLTIMGAAGGMIAFSANRILSTTIFEWWLEVPLASGTIILGTTLIYYLRWTHAWFAELARLEFANRKFEADVSRASWIAELFFEYKDERKEPLPPDLIKSFTQNLFQDVKMGPQSYHPADQLAESLKNIQALKVNKDGAELTLK